MRLALDSLSAVKQNSKNAKIFCLVHTMDRTLALPLTLNLTLTTNPSPSPSPNPNPYPNQVHKMDLIPEEQRDPVFRQRERELMRLAQPLGLTTWSKRRLLVPPLATPAAWDARLRACSAPRTPEEPGGARRSPEERLSRSALQR